jgi:hypothetical protein
MPEDQTISIAQAGAFETETAWRDYLNPTLKDGQAFDGLWPNVRRLPRERWALSPFGEYWLAYRVGMKNQRGS